MIPHRIFIWQFLSFRTRISGTVLGFVLKRGAEHIRSLSFSFSHPEFGALGSLYIGHFNENIFIICVPVINVPYLALRQSP